MNQENNDSKKSNLGLILAIVGGGLALVLTAVLIIVFLPSSKPTSSPYEKTEVKTSTFYAEGYSLEYDSSWTKKKVKNSNGDEEDTLMYGDKEAYLIPVGNSALSGFEDNSDVKFSTSEGKKKLYDQFYSYWSRDDVKITDGSNGFQVLTGNIYYASMDYQMSRNNTEGKMYVLVSEDNNIVISLMSNITTSYSRNSERIVELLKTIKITKKYDDEMANTLNSMSNWNRYSSLRQGKLGTKKDINGGWNILSDSESYWVFKNGEFWWYKSKDDLTDNYWYGKTRILTGKQGLKEVGLSEDKVDYITANAGGKVSASDIYTIILTPSKIISGGVDKSSTNITGEDWHMVWIIVDHGSEGLEAQVLNVKTSDTSYYVKIND